MAAWLVRLSVIVALMVLPRQAFAFCAGTGPLCQVYSRYEAIFDGTVAAIDRVDLPDDHPGTPLVGHRLVTFDVHKAWKGVTGARVQVLLESGYGVNYAESFQVAAGRRYVVFADRQVTGYLMTSACDPSRAYEQADGVLEFLATLERPPAGGRMSGTTFMTASPFEPPSGFAGPPAVEADVVLTGEGQTRTTRSRGGRYSFDALPAGEFAVRVTVPPNLAVSPPDGLVRLADLRACASVAFVFRHDTKIAGAIVSASGRAMKNVPVDLVDADSLTAGAPRLRTVRTDDSGSDEFLGAPPGRYLVGVNVYDVASAERPYPRVAYPGDGEPAAVLTAAIGEPPALTPLVVPDALQRLRLWLTIVWQDGTPAANIAFSLEDRTDGQPSRGGRIEFTDGRGRAEIDGWMSRKYVVSRWDYSGDKPTRLSASRPFTVASAEPIRIVLRRTQ